MANKPNKKDEKKTKKSSGVFSLLGILRIISVVGMIISSAVVVFALKGQPITTEDSHTDPNLEMYNAQAGDAGSQHSSSHATTKDSEGHDSDNGHQNSQENTEHQSSRTLLDDFGVFVYPAYGSGVLFFLLLLLSSKRKQIDPQEPVAPASVDDTVLNKIALLTSRMDSVERGAAGLLQNEFEKLKEEKEFLSGEIKEFKRKADLKIEEELIQLREENARLQQELSSFRNYTGSKIEAAE